MKYYYFTAVLLGGLLGEKLPAQAQFTEKYKAQRFAQEFGWAEVMLTSGEKIQGPLTLHWSEDMLVLTQQGQHVLPVVEVSHFRVQQEQLTAFTDQKKRFDFGPMRRGYYPGNTKFTTEPTPYRLPDMPATASRVFHTCYWSHTPTDPNFRALGFFEQLSAGPTMLLRREALALQTQYIAGGIYGGASYKRVVKQDGLYLSRPDGSLVPLEKADDFYQCFQPFIPQIQEFARQHKLSFSKPNELAYLVNYANSLGSKL